jgi:outer membrane protein OmpA-like peptidoglycan-associated protein
MKRLFVFALTACVMTAQEVGQNAFALLQTGYGASAPALGGAGVAWTKDATGIWWNPAGLEGLDRGEVLLGYRSWLAGMHDEYLGFAWPLRRSSLGLAALYSLTAVEEWNEANEPVGKVYPQSAVFDLAWAYSLRRGLSLGIGAKLLYENLVEVGGLGGVFDAGLRWQALEWMNVGVSLHDFGPGVFYAGERISTPWGVNAGVTFDVIEEVVLSAGAGYVSDAGLEGRIGAEYRPFSILAVRAGTRINSSVIEWGPYGVLGTTHSVSVSRSLKERPASADVLVKVIDSEDGFPLDAHLMTRGVIEEEREINGSLRRNWVDTGLVYVKAETKHYYASADSMFLKEGKLNVLEIQLDSIPYGILKGIVREESSKSPTDATVYFKGEVEDSTRTDPGWGTYQSNPLPPGEYLVKVTPDNPTLFPSIERADVTPGDTVTSDLYVSREIRANVLMTLYLNFETGKADILPAHEPILDTIAPILKNNADRGLVIEIAGHTDNVPVLHCPYGDNQRLSEARSEAVMAYLVNKHELPKKMFVCEGYGETEPIASNENPEGRAMNRRIEFRLISGEE